LSVSRERGRASFATERRQKWTMASPENTRSCFAVPPSNDSPELWYQANSGRSSICGDS